MKTPSLVEIVSSIVNYGMPTVTSGKITVLGREIYFDKNITRCKFYTNKNYFEQDFFLSISPSYENSQKVLISTGGYPNGRESELAIKLDSISFYHHTEEQSFDINEEESLFNMSLLYRIPDIRYDELLELRDLIQHNKLKITIWPDDYKVNYAD